MSHLEPGSQGYITRRTLLKYLMAGPTAFSNADVRADFNYAIAEATHRVSGKNVEWVRDAFEHFGMIVLRQVLRLWFV